MGGLFSKSRDPEEYFRALEGIQILSTCKTPELLTIKFKYNQHAFEFRQYPNGKTYMCHPIKGAYSARRLDDYRSAIIGLTHLNDWKVHMPPLPSVVDADIWPDHIRPNDKEVRFNLLGLNHTDIEKTVNALKLCAMNTGVEIGKPTHQMQIILCLTEIQCLEFQSHCALNSDLNIHWKDHTQGRALPSA